MSDREVSHVDRLVLYGLSFHTGRAEKGLRRTNTLTPEPFCFIYKTSGKEVGYDITPKIYEIIKNSYREKRGEKKEFNSIVC
jgi:hypothetical protein